MTATKFQRASAKIHTLPPPKLTPEQKRETEKNLSQDERSLLKAEKRTATAYGFLAGLIMGLVAMFFAYDFMAEKTMDRSRADIVKTELAKKALEEALK